MEVTKKAREIYDKLAKGWNTWDVNSVTAHVHLPSKLRLNLAFIVPHLTGYSGNSLWENVKSFGEHAVDGSYTEVFIRYLGGVYKIETSAVETELLIKLTPIKSRYNNYVLLEVGSIWGGKVILHSVGDKILASSERENFVIDTLSEKVELDWNPSNFATIACSVDHEAYFTVNSSKTKDEVDVALRAAREKWLKSTISADGNLREGLEAMRRSLLWNTIYDSRHKRVITPVSRNWCRNKGAGFGDYVIFGWDTFFAALQFGLVDKDLAYANMFAILEEITPEGMVPNFGCANGGSRDRSEPQVGSLCAWKLYLQFKDKWFIEECFDRLLTWNRWRFRERDFNGDGLLELGSLPWDAALEEEYWRNDSPVGGKLGASLESGIDNSPMWDRVKFNEEKHCHELSFVGLNAEMIFDCECLEKMAALLGRDAERKELEERRLRLSELINEELWDETRGFYMNKHWSGEFDPCLSLTGFYPITAGIVSDEKLNQMLSEHLLNEKEFWGDYVIPNVSRNDPSFEEQEYWRGRIWAPTNFIVGEGILRSEQMIVWEELVKKGLNLFMKCWKERGVVGENYNAITGEAAEPGKASDRFYHWGALLVYMAVERIINFNEWKDCIEVYGYPEWLGGLRNVPIGDRKVNVSKDGIKEA